MAKVRRGERLLARLELTGCDDDKERHAFVVVLRRGFSLLALLLLAIDFHPWCYCSRLITRLESHGSRLKVGQRELDHLLFTRVQTGENLGRALGETPQQHEDVLAPVPVQPSALFRFRIGEINLGTMFWSGRKGRFDGFRSRTEHGG